jgi:cyclic pyranopterin phosphate synthase
MVPVVQSGTELEAVTEYYAHPPCVILHLTDRCNLECSFCGKGVPFQKKDELRDLAVSDLEHIAELLKDYPYDILKISGGEPTLHKSFAEITRSLPDLFPGKKYYLATNGVGLQKFQAVLHIYDRIDLSYYPGAVRAS